MSQLGRAACGCGTASQGTGGAGGGGPSWCWGTRVAVAGLGILGLTGARLLLRHLRAATHGHAAPAAAARLPVPPVVTKYHKLGSSNLLVSNVCLGTMTWGGQVNEQDAHAQLDAFVHAGGNFIDTAEMYPTPVIVFKPRGRTEEIIGTWLAKHDDRMRQRVVITTKVAGPQSNNDVSANRTHPPNPDAAPPRVNRANIQAAVEGSLRRLQTSYIDLLLIHWPDRPTPLWGRYEFDPNQVEQNFTKLEGGRASFDEQVQAMGELIRAGKVRYWGLSNETSYGVGRFCEACDRLGVPRPVVVQNDFSLLNRRFESELAETCAPGNFDLSLTPYGCLAGGALSGKYLDNNSVPNARFTLFPDFQPRYHSERSQRATRAYQAIAAAEGMSADQLSLAWAASRWYVGSVIIGATTPQQLLDNIGAVQIELRAETLKAVDEVHASGRNPALTN